ncbi:ABC transporter ATP-binding protein [Candidatus Saccharibacteria bacterium]|nr:ABC transporter ATP-binding protein [Candidatus Saccharibacteria bacterium]
MRQIARILKYTSVLWRYYFAISIFTILLAVMTLVQPFITGKVIDELRMGTEARVGFVLFMAAIIFILDFSSTIFSNIGGYIGDQMKVKLSKILSERYYQHILQLPQQYFDTELTGKIINRLNRSITQIADFMQMMSNNFLQFIFSTIFSLVVVAFYSWQVALLLFALYPIFILMTVRTSNTWLKFQAKKNEHSDIASGRFAEAIGQVKVVKSFIQEKRELSFLNKHYSAVVFINRPQSKYWHVNDIKRRLILNAIFFGVYALIFVQAAQGTLTPGEAVALILYAMNIRIPIFTISFLVENTQRAVSDSKDYFEIMEIKPQISDSFDAKTLKISKGAIRFQEVSFAYDSKPVLNNISFGIKPDSKVALVGESGEGKTTLTNLLMRLYEPQTGSIQIDGQDITTVTQSSLRNSIGVVFQDPALFSGSIAENISYANPKASREQIIAAAKAANADEFVDKLKKGYETEIGERGLRLSGGQKQRIAIARALLKDAPILVLDEATSSLDSRSEAMVQEALERLMKNRTTIIIAHRLSTIQNVDEIITFKNGAVVEIGSPNKLAKSGGIYAQLLELQMRKPTERTKQQLKDYEMAV